MTVSLIINTLHISGSIVYENTTMTHSNFKFIVLGNFQLPVLPQTTPYKNNIIHVTEKVINTLCSQSCNLQRTFVKIPPNIDQRMITELEKQLLLHVHLFTHLTKQINQYHHAQRETSSYYRSEW